MELPLPSRFNVRVYFILFNDENNAVLASDEVIRKQFYTKFPGGGLEFGEGTIACVQREAMEELGQSVEVLNHFYTTEFYMRSAFHASDQVLSIYYTAQLQSSQLFKTSTTRFDFKQHENDEECFRWIKLENLSVDDFQFPADKEVVKLILEQYNT